MGIKDLNNVINRVCPNVRVETHLSKMHGKAIAIDTSLYVYKYIKSQGESLWLSSIIRMLCTLKKNRIKIVCVYDGKNAPIEKTNERKKRTEKRIKSELRLQEIQDVMSIISTEYMFSTSQTMHDEIIERVQKIVRTRRGINELNDPTNYTSAKECYKELEKLEASISAQTTIVTSFHINLMKEAVRLLGIPSVQANGEAEEMCSKLCKEGLVYGVLTEDTDIYVYNTPIVLSKLNVREESVIIVHMDGLLNELSLSYNSFVDLCIMLGCDYNERISGYGASKCYDMISKHLMIENIPLDVSSLKYKRCREIFMNDDKSHIKKESIYIFDFNHTHMKEFLRNNEVRIRYEELSKIWSNNVLFE